MVFFKNIIHSFKNSFNFQGRATRKEFWQFTLLYIFIYTPISLYESMRYALNNFSSYDISTWDIFLSSPLTLLVTLIFIFPILSLSCRRLHDIGKSGWYQLIYITIIGMIPLLYWFSLPGNPSANKFGLPNPIK